MTLIKINLKDFKSRSESGKVIFTVEDLDRFPEWPESPIVELINGELFMTPSPSVIHQKISKKLFTRLNQFIEKNELGELFYAPIDVVFSKESVVVPDLVYIAHDNRKIIQEENIQGVPDLIIEILSTNIKQDRDYKFKLYAKYGVTEYWIVDVKAKQLEIYTKPHLENKGHYVYQNKKVLSRDHEIISDLFSGLDMYLGNIFD